MALTLERRQSPRMTPASAGTDVLIMDAEEQWMLPGKLLDVSGDGALICPGILVSTGRQLCLLFERIPEAGWIDAEVVRSGRPGRVGIRFVTPLSSEFVRAATSNGKDHRNDDANCETPSLGDGNPSW